MNKHSKRPHSTQHDRTSLKPRPIPSTAYIQAHESQLIYGPEAETRAEELYSKRDDGRGMMKWQGYGDGDEDVWADRHDIIHLLTDLPSSSTSRTIRGASSPAPSSSSSWDSIPSDLEETFHLSDPVEIEGYERKRRIQRIEMLREARLKEREQEDMDLDGVDEKGKGKASWLENEIPTPDILKLMNHTATALYASPNPQILESRILLNHTSDPRFEFLRGRWKDTWQGIKKDARAKKDLASGRSEREKKVVGSLIGGYQSDSDSEHDSDVDEDEDAPPPPPPPLSPPVPPSIDMPPPPSDDDEGREETLKADKMSTSTTSTGQNEEVEKQRLRRLKAEEWKRKRAQAKG